MFGRKVDKGLDITRESWRALLMDKELIVFPFISVVAGAAVVATICLAGVLIPEFGHWALNMLNKNAPHSPAERALGLACLFAVYYVEWFVVVYFNTALVGCAMMRFSAEQRLGWLGKLVIRLIGLAWAVSTYFVVPVLAAEGAGPITAVRRSVSLLRKTWGEGLTGNFVINLFTWVVLVPLIAFSVGGFMLAAALDSDAIRIVTMAVLMICVTVMAIVTSALRQSFLAALYRYATTGEVAQGFSQETMAEALRHKHEPALATV